MKLIIGADHGGFQMKTELVTWLQLQGHELIDAGANKLDPGDDYPDIVEPAVRLVALGRAQRGILICGSGVGACVAANKVPGIRASLCHDTYSAHQGVEHDDMNAICLGARVVGIELAKELITAFINARFSSEPRFRRRLNKVLAIESRSLQGKTSQT